MKMVRLGNTGVTVSRICLGCMSYGDPKWRAWVLDERAAMPFFRRAVENGVNFFDTADMYSLGISEEFTGRSLREYAKLDECIVATKVFNAMSDGPNMKGLSRKHIVQGCEASLRRLGIETIDLYMLHRPDLLADPEEVAKAFSQLKEAGKVRYFGVSNFRPTLLTALQVVCRMPLVVHQVEISLAKLDAFTDGTLDQCLIEQITPWA